MKMTMVNDNALLSFSPGTVSVELNVHVYSHDSVEYTVYIVPDCRPSYFTTSCSFDIQYVSVLKSNCPIQTILRYWYRKDRVILEIVPKCNQNRAME